MRERNGRGCTGHAQHSAGWGGAATKQLHKSNNTRNKLCREIKEIRPPHDLREKPWEGPHQGSDAVRMKPKVSRAQPVSVRLRAASVWQGRVGNRDASAQTCHADWPTQVNHEKKKLPAEKAKFLKVLFRNFSGTTVPYWFPNSAEWWGTVISLAVILTKLPLRW